MGQAQGTAMSGCKSKRRIASFTADQIWLVAVITVTLIVCSPFIRTVFGQGGDEGVLLNGAIRLLNGKRLYVDFFEFLPPGGFLLIALWFKFLGTSIVSARAFAILSIVGVAAFTYKTAWHASKKASIAGVLTVAWVLTSQGFATQVSHHWLTTLFSMIAFWAAVTNVERPSFWGPIVSGAAVGTGLMITPHRGLLAGGAALISFCREISQIQKYMLASSVIPVGVLFYLIYKNAVGAAFNDVVRFTLERYAPIQGLPYGSGPPTPLIYVIPLAGLLVVGVLVGDWRKLARDRVFHACLGFGVASLLGCFPRPDTFHIALAAPLSLPAIAYCASKIYDRFSGRPWLRAVRWAAVGVLIGACSRPVVFLSVLSMKAILSEPTPTQRGDIKLFMLPEGNRLLQSIMKAPMDQTFFFYPMASMLPYLSGRDQISKYDLFWPGYTTAVQYKDACGSVLKSADWIVDYRRLTRPEYLVRLYPAMMNPNPIEKRSFEKAIDDSFDVVSHVGEFELRFHRAQIIESLCTKVSSAG